MTGRRRTWRRAMEFDRALPDELIERFWGEPDALIAAGRMLKDGDRSTVVEITVASRSYVLKRSNPRDLFHSTVHAFLRTRARWNWVNGLRLGRAGIRTPPPRAILEERFGPLRGRSFLIVDHIEGRTLRRVLADGCAAEDAEVMAADFAGIWERLGRCRLGHDDMKPANFLVDDQHRFWLVDLDAMRVQRLPPLFHRQRRQDYAIFMTSFDQRPEVGAIFRRALEARQR